MLTGEQRTRAPEAGCDLVQDQQQTVAPRHVGDGRQHLRVVELHTGGRLNERLENNTGQATRVFRDGGIELREALLTPRQVQDDLLRQYTFK